MPDLSYYWYRIFVISTKLPAMVLAWKNLQEVFVILVIVVVLYHWRFFIHCFSTSSFTLPWTIAGLLHPFYAFSPAHRRVIPDTFILTALRFWAGVFYQQAFFILHSFPTFWYVFVKQMRAGTPDAESSSLPALTDWSLPADAWS